MTRTLLALLAIAALYAVGCAKKPPALGSGGLKRRSKAQERKWNLTLSM